MQLSCPVLSLLTRAEFALKTQRQNSNPPNGKRQIRRDRKSETGDMKGAFHKAFYSAGQTANPIYYCDILQRLRENVRRLRPELLAIRIPIRSNIDLDVFLILL
jgi:hypothetical protein